MEKTDTLLALHIVNNIIERVERPLAHLIPKACVVALKRVFVAIRRNVFFSF